MVTRRTRNFKERNQASDILGRFIMPVAVLMALALFYFSIKLFFFSPPREEPNTLPNIPASPEVTEPYEPDRRYTEPDTPDNGQSELPPENISEPVTEPAETTPDDNQTHTKKPAEEPKQQAPQSTRKPPAPQNTQKPAPGAAPQVTGPRWDVQIGGFRARSGAELTVKQAKEKGYSAYIVEEKLDGQPFFKVRVRGHKEKKDAQALSKKLEAAGFPVYVLSVK